MKKYIVVCFLILVSYAAHAQDRQAILKVMHNQELAWNRGDIDGFMQGYWKSDSLLFVGQKGHVYSWKSTIERYKKTYPDKATMGQLTFTILQVKVLDATNAFLFGGWKLKRDKDEPGGYYTLWFKKIKCEWKIVCDHTS